MKKYRIYTAGKMSGLDLEEQMRWRLDIMRRVEKEARQRSGADVLFIHPPMFYQYGANYHKSEREVKEWDTTQVLSCDIVIVNTDHVSDSTGTHYELAMCDVANRLANRHIFVIGIGDTEPKDLHPWIAESIMRYEKDFQDAAEYIADYLLI